MKHLLYEHQNNITTLKADGELALKLQQDEFRKHEGDLGKDKRNLKLELKEQVGGGAQKLLAMMLLWHACACAKHLDQLCGNPEVLHKRAFTAFQVPPWFWTPRRRGVCSAAGWGICSGGSTPTHLACPAKPRSCTAQP